MIIVFKIMQKVYGHNMAHKRVRACTHTFTHTHTCAHAHTHTCVHIHAHAHTIQTISSKSARMFIIRGRFFSCFLFHNFILLICVVRMRRSRHSEDLFGTPESLLVMSENNGDLPNNLRMNNQESGYPIGTLLEM